MTPTQQIGIRIWWDTSVDAYRVVTPFNAKFVEALKTLIPVSDRSWDPSARVWTIAERFFPPVKELCEKVFGQKATVITREQAERAAQPPSVAKTPLESAIVEFFKLLPQEAARKAYHVASAQVHPDHGGDMEKMSRLNALWQRLEAELYGR